MMITPDPTITMKAGGDRGMEIIFYSARDARPVSDMTVYGNYQYYRQLAELQAERIDELTNQLANSWTLREKSDEHK